MRWVVATAAVAVALAGAGCGQSEESKAREASIDFLTAVSEEDLGEVCELMADSLKRRILGPLGDVIAQRKERCAEAMRPRLGQLPQVEDPEATRTEVTRANARVAVSGEGEDGSPVRTTIELRKNRKQWQVTGY